MDYKTLTEQLRGVAGECGKLCKEAATAIETLYAERGAALNMLRGDCHACAHNLGWHNLGECASCMYETARQHGSIGKREDKWVWKGSEGTKANN